MTAQPAVADNPYVIDGIDMRVLARRQRWVLWLVVASLLSFCVPFLMGATGAFIDNPVAMEIMTDALLIVRLGVLVGVVLLMRAMRTNIVLLIICTILLIFPFLNLLILLLENSGATRRLRKAGLKVGFMGVRDEQVILKLGRGLCRTCGYDLTGNVSGVCPECGARISPIADFIARPVAKS